METNIAISIDVVKDKARYDAGVKEVLADKQVLARILKYTLDEFKEDSIDEIINCISEPEIGSVRVEPGATNTEKVSQTNNEDDVLNEGKIYFDIRFNAYTKNEQIKILINVEAQKSTDSNVLHYHLDNRIVFYLGRMISAQKEVEFTKSNYDDLKAVKSIWICMDSGDDDDSINRFSFKQEIVFGKEMSLPNIYKVQGVVIRLRKNESAEESKNRLIAMLEELLSKEPVEEKKKKLSENFGMKMTTDTERRLGVMCNLSDVIEERGIESGMNKMSILYAKLEETDRLSDYSKAMKDEKYLKQLLAEFDL